VETHQWSGDGSVLADGGLVVVQWWFEGCSMVIQHCPVVAQE